MEKKSNNQYAYIAIVAIVAIVALVMLFSGCGATKVIDSNSENIAGQAINPAETFGSNEGVMMATWNECKDSCSNCKGVSSYYNGHCVCEGPCKKITVNND